MKEFFSLEKQEGTENAREALTRVQFTDVQKTQFLEAEQEKILGSIPEEERLWFQKVMVREIQQKEAELLAMKEQKKSGGVTGWLGSLYEGFTEATKKEADLEVTGYGRILKECRSWMGELPVEQALLWKKTVGRLFRTLPKLLQEVSDPWDTQAPEHIRTDYEKASLFFRIMERADIHPLLLHAPSGRAFRKENGKVFYSLGLKEENNFWVEGSDYTKRYELREGKLEDLHMEKGIVVKKGGVIITEKGLRVQADREGRVSLPKGEFQLNALGKLEKREQETAQKNLLKKSVEDTLAPKFLLVLESTEEGKERYTVRDSTTKELLVSNVRLFFEEGQWKLGFPGNTNGRPEQLKTYVEKMVEKKKPVVKKPTEPAKQEEKKAEAPVKKPVTPEEVKKTITALPKNPSPQVRKTVIASATQSVQRVVEAPSGETGNWGTYQEIVEYLEQEAKTGEVQLLLGKFYYKAGQYPKAVAVLERAAMELQGAGDQKKKEESLAYIQMAMAKMEVNTKHTLHSQEMKLGRKTEMEPSKDMLLKTRSTFPKVEKYMKGEQVEDLGYYGLKTLFEAEKNTYDVERPKQEKNENYTQVAKEQEEVAFYQTGGRTMALQELREGEDPKAAGMRMLECFLLEVAQRMQLQWNETTHERLRKIYMGKGTPKVKGKEGVKGGKQIYLWELTTTQWENGEANPEKLESKKLFDQLGKPEPYLNKEAYSVLQKKRERSIEEQATRIVTPEGEELLLYSYNGQVLCEVADKKGNKEDEQKKIQRLLAPYVGYIHKDRCSFLRHDGNSGLYAIT